jgi:hypothetical protein
VVGGDAIAASIIQGIAFAPNDVLTFQRNVFALLPTKVEVDELTDGIGMSTLRDTDSSHGVSILVLAEN